MPPIKKRAPAPTKVKTPKVTKAEVECVKEIIKQQLTPAAIPAKIVAVLPDFMALGQAVALVDLAETYGMGIEGIAETPAKLLEIGLAKKPERSVLQVAHKLYRDRVDSMLWRCNRPLTQTPPELTIAEAKEVIATPAIILGSLASTPTNGIEVSSVKVGAVIPAREPAARGEGITRSRTLLFGYPGTAVIRWMGKQGLTLDKAKMILKAKGLESLSDSTIKIQLSAGAKGQRGDAAPLTKEQEIELLACCKGA